MKALVTGGAGFIGSNLAIELVKKGYEVTVIDNLSTGNKNNLKEFKGNIINYDLSIDFDIEDKFDAIFHQAAITDPRYEDDVEMLRSNLKGFENIVKLAKKNKCPLIYASSASIYGNGKAPQNESQSPDIKSAYAKSKLMIENMALALANDLKIVGLRYFNVFGPNEASKGRPASMIYHLLCQMKKQQNPRIFEWGEQKRDHIYVKDVVKAILLALNAKSGIYNVGTGKPTTFNELVHILNEVLKTSLKPEYFKNPYKGSYQEHTQADTTKSEECLGFKPDYRLKDAIIEYSEMI